MFATPGDYIISRCDIAAISVMSAVIDVRCLMTFPHYLPIVPALTEHHWAAV